MSHKIVDASSYFVLQQVQPKRPKTYWRCSLQVSILRGLKERYEVHHGVRLQDAALVSAAQLSHRYIADRFLPDKAIDLVDEAAAKLNIEASGYLAHETHPSLRMDPSPYISTSLHPYIPTLHACVTLALL